MRWLKNQLLTLVLSLALVPVLPSAGAQSPCHLLSSATPVPEGAGAAYNLFSSARETLLNVDCSSAPNVALGVGNGEDSLYIYKTGYEWTGVAWSPFSFSGSRLVTDDWYIGHAEANLVRSQSELNEQNAFIAYTCVWVRTRWKCGCHSTKCSQNYWQLQTFKGGASGSASGDGKGGAMVYSWQPKASWIDGVSLSQRDMDNIVKQQFIDGASVGGQLVKDILVQGSNGNVFGYNRAPTGHPSIEIYTPSGTAGGTAIASVQIRLHEPNQGSPRRMRVVMEVKTSKPSDSTTYKSQGFGPTGGQYTDWVNTHSGSANAPIKYFIGIFGGEKTGPYGGGRANWWKGESVISQNVAHNRIGVRWQSASGSKLPNIYSYNYDRPNQFGGSQDDYTPPSSSRIDSAGVKGIWHRIEIDLKLADPHTVPENAVYNDPPIQPSRTGNGFVRHYLTRDMEGESGFPGTRQEVAAATGLITFPRLDNVTGQHNQHINSAPLGPWLNFLYGGSVGSQGQGWSWVRKIEVYEY